MKPVSLPIMRRQNSSKRGGSKRMGTPTSS
jgi:hypothetical protein